MKRLILTGGIASGKSTVSKIFQKAGFKIIDADKISNQILDENADIISSMFGYNGDDLRGYLRERVFFNPKDKFKLESFMHPKIKDAIESLHIRYVSENVKHIFDIPLYFEKSEKRDDDFKILVSTTYENQVKRLGARNNFDQETANRRILNQLPTSVKQKLCDYEIKNDGTKKELSEKVNQLIERIERGII